MTEERTVQMRFLEARKKLAEIADGKYCCMTYDLVNCGNSQHEEAVCKVYIDGKKWHQAPTWEMALDSICGGTESNPDLEEAPVEEVA